MSYRLRSNASLFDPAHMSFDEYFSLTQGMSEKEKLLNFGMGLDGVSGLKVANAQLAAWHIVK
jgi:hypothetical protein